MRANKPSPLDKKAELLKNKKEKEKAEESEEEDDEDEEEEEDDEDDEMDDKNQKSKQPATKSTLNKDIKPAVTKKEEIKPKPVSQIPTGVYKSKLVTNQKQEINKPKENITSTNTSGGSSIRRNILEKKSQVPAKPTTNTNTTPLSQNKNQIYQTQQTQPKAQPLQKPLYNKIKLIHRPNHKLSQDISENQLNKRKQYQIKMIIIIIMKLIKMKFKKSQ